MAEAIAPNRCGIDTVAVARIERLLRDTPAAGLRDIFSESELTHAGEGPARAASLAAAFAAKEACVKLFPREAAMWQVEPQDFAVAHDAYGAPRIVCSERASAVLGRHRIGRIALSLTHEAGAASAVALAEPTTTEVPLAGRLLYVLLPLRRDVILGNLERVFGAYVPREEIVRLAQAHYGHLWRLAGEFLRFRWRSAQRRAALVRFDNLESLTAAVAQGKGVLVLTGHFGNFEVATLAGLGHHPAFNGRFHFVRRAIKPRWLDALVTRRFRKGGFGVLAKRGSLDAILERLAAGDIVVFPFDQHAGPPDGIAIDFFGVPAWTFKSLAIIALATGAPVVPASSWREARESHVLRFEAPLAPIDCPDATDAIRRNTRAYNEVLERLILRRPEQWWWVHRRWKPGTPRAKRAAERANEGTRRPT
jgi:KDO2-lipid IV(A) lauroyltransferase